MNRFPKQENLTPFEKGKSGNPKGRPKGAKNLSTVLAALLEKTAPEQVRNSKEIAGFIKKKAITVEDALAARLLYEAIIVGNMKAIAEINKMLGNYAPTKLSHEGQRRRCDSI